MKKNIFFISLLAVLIMLFTFPLVFKAATHIPGFFSSDEPYSALWDSWHIKDSFINKLPLFESDLISYPFGAKFYNSGYLPYLWFAWFYSLSVLTTAVIAYNIQVLSNFFFSGLFTFLLAYKLTKNSPAAMLSAIIFTFCPYQFARSWQHLSLTYSQWIPMVILAAILLKERLSPKRILFFGLSLLLLFSFDYSVMFLGAVAMAAWFAYVLAYGFKQKDILRENLDYIKKAFTTGLVVFIILGPQFYPVIKNRLTLSGKTQASAYNLYHRPFGDLYEQSARPLSYFLPATTHPVFGEFTKGMVGSPLYGVSFTEHSLYLGWLPLILSFLVFKRWRKYRKTRGQRRGMRDEEEEGKEETLTVGDDFYIGFFLTLAAVAWLFSQPPTWDIGPLKIPMPSYFVYKILPMFRAYCRFGIVLELAVAVLAGFGLKYTLDKHSGNNMKQRIISGLCCAVLLFEFWNWPPYKVIDISRAPQVYYWLKSQPGKFAIAQYPMDTSGPNDVRKFYQVFHQKPIVNATAPNTYPNLVSKMIARLSKLQTASILAGMGVKYALVHRQEYMDSEKLEDIEELDLISRNTGLKFIVSFPPQSCPEGNMCAWAGGQVDVYEVTAKPAGIPSPIEP